MKELRIKIKVGQFEVELEGDSVDVKETLKSLKKDGFGNLLGNSTILEQAIIVPEEDNNKQLSLPSDVTIHSCEFPSLREVVINQLPKSETEWILVYAFYVIQEKGSFSKDDILKMYKKSNRWSKSNTANFAHNFNQGFKKRYFTTLNDTDNLLTKSGSKHGMEILKRTEGATRTTGSSKKAGTKSSSSSTNKTKLAVKSDLKVISDLDLNPKDKVGLSKCLEDYNLSSSTQRNLLFVYYLSEVLKISSITYNHIFSCYRWLEIKFPNAFVQSIRDTKAKNGWLLSATNGEIEVSPKGLNAILKFKK